MRFYGPYAADNGACPYLEGRNWAAEYVIAEDDGRPGSPPFPETSGAPSAGDEASDSASESAPHFPLLPWRMQRNSFEEDVPPAAALPVPHPDAPSSTYNELLQAGFRRSGRAFYRPHCADCAECVSLRVDVARFVPGRDMRRALKKNRDVTVEVVPVDPTRSQEPSPHDESAFGLYQKFVEVRYPTPTSLPTPMGYQQSFLVHAGNTWEFRYHVGDRLLGAGFVDLTYEAASSVYFFFDPEEAWRSLGTYSVLREIDFCRQTGRPWLYLGFRVAQCRAMG